MAHIDTLQVYEDLVTSGVPDKQAKAQVHALNASFDSVVTKSDLNNLEKLIIYIGGAILAVHTYPILIDLKNNHPALLSIVVLTFVSILGIFGIKRLIKGK